MTIIRWTVGVLGAASALMVLSSVLRTVMLPRAVPAFIARAAFLPVPGLLRAVEGLLHEEYATCRGGQLAPLRPVGP